MDPEISFVVPALNEAGALPAVVEEIARAFAGRRHEIIVVDDGSRDATATVLAGLKAARPGLRVLRHARTAGQSRAILTGVRAARAPLIVTLDGDGQNDPKDAVTLVAALEADAALALVAGERTWREDSLVKRVASRLANGLRRRVLGDGAADAGCGLKAFRREAFLRLPYFDHMHRFLPALFRREGFRVAYRPVRGRPRRHGVSNYSVIGRLWVSIWDLAGVIWLAARARDPGGCEEL
ncbi:MAG TPA: glycosyltransferase family 2 protein [Caulobacteraceae bacterium]|nr:glycosyltransferase family 2 protein [Caulobacteraceae bacterium]